MRIPRRAATWQRRGPADTRPNRPAMPLENDAAYDCPVCFEPNFVAVDPSGGRRQRFVEDCPVCCRPIAFVVEVDRDGDPIVVSAELDA